MQLFNKLKTFPSSVQSYKEIPVNTARIENKSVTMTRWHGYGIWKTKINFSVDLYIIIIGVETRPIINTKIPCNKYHGEEFILWKLLRILLVSCVSLLQIMVY